MERALINQAAHLTTLINRAVDPGTIWQVVHLGSNPANCGGGKGEADRLADKQDGNFKMWAHRHMMAIVTWAHHHVPADWPTNRMANITWAHLHVPADWPTNRVV